ncbi:MAG TPA: hypothetical protein VKG23_15195 [Thermoanaerobaculia bacterium]|nr:hypothetical protein [Thermoanaerobaculia bacterium]
MPGALSDRRDRSREAGGVALLAGLGLGTRLAFQSAFPTLPFYDPLQLVHFGELIRDQGLAGKGWYWINFNAGLPVVLGMLFRTGWSPLPLARIATACATGLVGLIPFLIWRKVLPFRWRLLAGILFALWPGQIFFAGVVVQDNWLLPPMVALACLAVRRLRSAEEPGRPLVAGLLYAACFAIRQEMLIVLLPLAVPAGVSRRGASRTRRDAALLAGVTAVSLLLLGLQRREATGRFAVTTGHGALALFGSFMPGSGTGGWTDARAYAEALEPSLPRGLYGSPEQMVRLTWKEVERRPAFHLLRVASWLPRLALYADADNLFWSVGSPRSVSPEDQPAATRFERVAKPLLIGELAIVQGLFVAALFIGIRRRRWDILALAATIGLKFAVHTIVSPVGRLAVPAIALELLTIPLAAAELEGSSRALRVRSSLVGAIAAALLLAITPPLAALVRRRDSNELPGVRSFNLDAGLACRIRCELQSGVSTGLTWTTVWLSADRSGRAAALVCELPVLEPDSVLRVTSDGTPKVSADGVPVPHDVDSGSAFTVRDPNAVKTISIEHPSGSGGALRFEAVRLRPSAE